MSRFNRPASWLRFLFTPSQTKAPNPGELSNDVSLNQPYDGGGFPLFDPSQWAFTVKSATIASATTDLFTVPEDEIVRILAVAASVAAGVAPNVNSFATTQNNTRVSLSAPLLLVANGQRTGLTQLCPIIGPGHVFAGHHFGGDAATIIDWWVYFVRAPLGTVFYV